MKRLGSLVELDEFFTACIEPFSLPCKACSNPVFVNIFNAFHIKDLDKSGIISENKRCLA